MSRMTQAARRKKAATKAAAIPKFNSAVCSLLSQASSVLGERSLQQSNALGAHLAPLSLATYRVNEPCDDSCSSMAVTLRMFTCEAGNTKQAAAMNSRRHVFLPSDVTTAARDIGALPALRMGEEDADQRVFIHVCGQFCPTRQKLDALHSSELRSNKIASMAYFCKTHARFHVCDTTCTFRMMASDTTTRCPLSARTFSNNSNKFSFGDGTGTAERAANKKATPGGSNTAAQHRSAQKRRSELVVNTKKSAPNSAGKRRGVGGAGASGGVTGRKKSRKTRAMSGTGASGGTSLLLHKQAVIKCLLSAKDHRALRKSVALECGEVVASSIVTDINGSSEAIATDSATGDSQVHTIVDVRPNVPFERREVGILESELALDELYQLHCRPTLTRRFAVPPMTRDNTFFANGPLLSAHLARAYEIINRMFFGFQRAAIESRQFARAHDTAQRAVQQHVTSCTKECRTLIVSDLTHIYRTAMGSRRDYTRLVLGLCQRQVVLAYYALIATEFYFQLCALPLDVPAEDVDADYATVRETSEFEHFVPIIIDMMRTDFVVDGVCVLPRDTFIVAEYAPDSTALRQMGMPEHTCTRLRNAIVMLLRAVSRGGVSLRRVQTTEFSLDELLTLANSSTRFNSIERIVTQFIDRRSERIDSVSRVVVPRDNAHYALVELGSLA